MKTSTCSCGQAATVAVTLPIRIMSEHRTEMRQCRYCPKCAAAFTPDRGATAVHPKTVEVVPAPAKETNAATFATARASFERNTREFVAALDRWYQTDREDPHALYSAAAWLTNISRNLSAYAGDMALAINHAENCAR